MTGNGALLSLPPLEAAIAALEEEVEAFNQGTNQQPADGSSDWFVLRAKALGLSQLRRMAQLGLHGDPAAAERFYRSCAKTFKKLDVPDPVEVVRETLPDGSLPSATLPLQPGAADGSSAEKSP